MLRQLGQSVFVGLLLVGASAVEVQQGPSFVQATADVHRRPTQLRRLILDKTGSKSSSSHLEQPGVKKIGWLECVGTFFVLSALIAILMLVMWEKQEDSGDTGPEAVDSTRIEKAKAVQEESEWHREVAAEKKKRRDLQAGPRNTRGPAICLPHSVHYSSNPASKSKLTPRTFKKDLNEAIRVGAVDASMAHKDPIFCDENRESLALLLGCGIISQEELTNCETSQEHLQESIYFAKDKLRERTLEQHGCHAFVDAVSAVFASRAYALSAYEPAAAVHLKTDMDEMDDSRGSTVTLTNAESFEVLLDHQRTKDVYSSEHRQTRALPDTSPVPIVNCYDHEVAVASSAVSTLAEDDKFPSTQQMQLSDVSTSASPRMSSRFSEKSSPEEIVKAPASLSEARARVRLPAREVMVGALAHRCA